MRKGKVLLVMVAVLAMAGAAGAQNLVVNGGFEAPVVNTSQMWDIYDSGTLNLGWNVEWYQGSTTFKTVTRPMPAHLELHRGVNSWVPDEGSQYAELDTDWDGPVGSLNDEPASVEIWQEFETCVGGTYRLSYAWSPRPNHTDNKMQVLINGAPVANHSGSGGSSTSWTTETTQFTATSATTRLAFIETGTPQSYGMFLDDVVVDVIECPCIVEDTVVDLCAGQTNNWGTVTVNNDDAYIYVDFNVTEPGWYLEETHVAVGDSLQDIPQTGGKVNNPIPGAFPYFCENLEPMQTSCTVEIPLGDWCAGHEIVVAAHAAVVEVAGDGCETIFWASEVFYSEQGLKKDGSAVDFERSDVLNALGAPDSPKPFLNFFSLGFGGWIDVGFGYPIYNGPGDDIVVEEVTWGTYPLEKADVFGMIEGVPYFAGEVTNNSGAEGTDYAALPDGKTTFDYLRVLDTSDLSAHNNAGDGYDLDAVGACYLLMGEETAWGDGCDGTRFTERGNWGTYFYYSINECAQCETITPE